MASGAGGVSLASNEVSKAVVAGAPTLVTAALTVGNGQVSIKASGQANGAAITSFSVLRGTTSAGESATPISTITPATTPALGATTGVYIDKTSANGTT